MTECNMKNENCGVLCTGFEGKNDWKELEELEEKMTKVVKNLGCESCADDGTPKINFLHDHVGLGLGKEAFDRENYHKVYEEITCVRNKCLSDGRC